MSKRTILSGVLMLAFAFSVWADEPIRRGNLVQNAGFTEGLKQWIVEPVGDTPMAQPEIDKSTFHGIDMASLKIPAETGKRAWLRQTGIPRDSRVKKYRLTVWTRSRDMTPEWIARFGVQQCKGGVYVRTLQNRHAPCGRDEDWALNEIVFEPPADAEQFAVYISLWYNEKLEATPAGGGALWFDDVSLVPILEGADQTAQDAAAQKIMVDAFQPLGERGLFLPGQPIQLSLSGKSNEAQKTGRTEIEFLVKDFWNTPAGQKTEKVTVAPDGQFTLTAELAAPEKLGFYCVTANIKKDGVLVTWPSTSFCVIDPVEEKDLYFGMDANSFYDGLLKAYRMIGVGSVGIHPTWAVPEDALKNLDEFEKKQVETRWAPFLESDFDIVGYVKIDPEFHAKRIKDETRRRRELGLFPYPDALFTELGDAVEAEARAMKDRIRTWIIQEEIDAWVHNPNAPAGSGTCELARHILMTRVACDRLKKVDAGFLVAGLGVCGDYAGDPPFQLVRRILPEIKGRCDAVAIDAYCGNYKLGQGVVPGPEAGRFRETLLNTQKLQAEWGLRKEIIIAEKGLSVPYHRPPDDPLQKALAVLTARNQIVGKSVRNVAFHSIYLGASAGACWRIRSQKLQSTEDHPLLDFGLWKLTQDAKGAFGYHPRSAVAAYATVARLLSNAADIDPIELNVRQGFYAYLFKKKDTTISALWTTDKKPYAVSIPLPVAAECVDLMGNTRPLPAGGAQLDISESPIFLTCKADPKALADAIEKTVFPSLPPVVGEAHLSDLSTLTFYLLNQTNQPVDAEIEADPLKSAQLADRMKKVTVPAAGRATVDFALAGADPAKLKNEVLSARVKSGGQSVSVTSDLGVIPIARAPEHMKVDGDLTKYANITPIVLDGVKDICPPMAAMPESHLWQGTHDLSAKCWLAWDAKDLYVAACVEDDAHMQRQKQDLIWMDDCLQFAFDTKNDALSPDLTGRSTSFGGLSGYDDNDYNMGAALTADGPQCYCWVDKGKTKKAGPRDFPLVVKRDGEATIYEMAIPWESLAPIEPKPGKVFRFSFIVFDSDKAEDTQAAYFMALTPGIAGGQDPSAYKAFMLAP